MNGIVFNIQRFCVDDGPGIRTTVFLKGCPLHCAWCHNPESQRKQPEIMFDASKCIYCGACAKICSSHLVSNGEHVFSRALCASCGKCTDACLTGAVELCGKEMNDDDVISIVSRDKPFYQNEGGMTLSGGEPLMQHEFALSLLKKAQALTISTAVETCGYTACNQLKEIAAYTDLFLFDLKLFDVSLHKKYTGTDNGIIMENLRLLNSLSKKIILRCPIIEGVNLNPQHIENVFLLSDQLSCIEKIEFEPYHPLGINKARLLDRKQMYGSEEFLDKNMLSSLIESKSHLPHKPYTIH